MNIKLPRFIQADKANHRVRGSEVAGVFASLAMLAAVLLLLSLPLWAVPAIGASAAILSAAAAGVLVERMQARANAVSAAHGGEPLHTVEKADIVATAYGSWPVAVALLVAAVLTAAKG